MLPASGPAADPGYARFFEIANVAFWTADAQGRATFAAQSMADRLGVESRVDSSEAQAELIHPDDRAFAVATWQGAVASGKTYDIEVRARSFDDGVYRWTRLQAVPDLADGVVIGWYGTTEDIHERRLATMALHESEARFRHMADELPVIVWLTDLSGGATYLSKVWCDLTGQTAAEANGDGWRKAICPEDIAMLDEFARHVAAHEPFELDYRLRRANGDYHWVHSSGRVRVDADGAPLGYAGCLVDIHSRKVAERELEATQHRLSRALDGTGVGVWEWDVLADEVRISGSGLQVSGPNYDLDEYRRIDYRDRIHPADLPGMLAALGAYVESGSGQFEFQVRVSTGDGGWTWVLGRGTVLERDDDGRVLQMVGTLTNIEASKRAEARLRWTVEHDALTGLGNRILFQNRLAQALAEAEADGGRVALALLDIDEFKTVNDVYGHPTGDAVLVALAARLSRFLHDGETVARLGGDEFTLILPHCGTDAEVAARLVALRAVLVQPVVHEGKTLTCGASIGVSVAPTHGNDSATLFKHADIAMYAAKAADRSGVAVFAPALADHVRRQAEARDAVRSALRDNRVAALYEPLVDLGTRRIVGIRALPSLGGDDPQPSHPRDHVAEEADIAVALGRRVCAQAFRAFVGCAGPAMPIACLEIYASAAELRVPGYGADLLVCAAEAGIAPERLRIAVGESVLSGSDVANVEAALAELRAAGVGIILDGFGIGGGIALLKRLPLTALRIAPDFVAGAGIDAADTAIVRAIVDLGHAFGLQIVADGITAAAQAEALHDLGCGYGGGPYFGAALPAERAAALFEA